MVKMTAPTYNLPVEHVVSYLKLKGWKLAHDNKRWYVFEGYEDIEGNPFEIVLPKNTSAPDYSIYVQQTVNILSSLTDKTPETITNDMLFYDRDILMVRVVESVDTISIPIGLAAKQISELKQLIAYAACSEKNAKTHFSNSASGNEMVKHYHFGHTFVGSFGYRIESPVGDEKHFHQEPRQMDLFEEGESVILPLQRRVMERIARGLAATEKAVNLQDVQPLIDGYAEGFNANMCTAILKMLNEQKEPIEYSIKWSHKIEVSDDVRNINNIPIQQRHFEYLETASKRLKELKPESKTIEGLVIGLSSSGDPLSEDVAERSILIKWDPPKRGRPRNIRITLEKDDYIKAHQAHLDWNTVSVNGIMQRKGSKWQLSEPQEFKILR